MSRTKVSDAAPGPPWNCPQGVHGASRGAGEEALQAGTVPVGAGHQHLPHVRSLPGQQCRVAAGLGPAVRPSQGLPFTLQ